MEGFLTSFPPFGISPVRGPLVQGSSWGKKEGRFVTPQGLGYLELCKAILSQVSPAVAPPLRKTATRECGVQVNAKVDKTVQCTLGPKTLFYKEDEAPLPSDTPRSPDPPSTPRFLRPVSIYSPVFDRRTFVNKLSEAAGREPPEDADQESDADPDQNDPRKNTKTTYQASKASKLQFLEQRYGFFHCKKCNIRWESAYVWCVSGTSKVYYKQLCRKCQMGFNPYRVESILCKGCSQTCCSCEKKLRHINMKRPHRQDLCCRCKGMRLSCDATYSFKYII
ncbi:ZAR1-like protein [Thalassophryne amazonica]|uniref:ZAR1-like protein n=1 Tax=Thalassophryne amazonica TaxID=390379 RepID=UPI0014709B28|nr:ZAR1-like protein [Thalassophryne amazonica]